MDNQVRRNLSLSIVNKAQQVDDLHRANQMGASSSDGAKGETCMVLNYETRKGTQKPIRQTSEFCVIGNGQFRQTVNAAYREGVTARFLSSYSETTVLLEEFSTLVKQNRKEEMLSLVKLFDNRITNIEVLFDGIYVKYQDIDEMLPLTMCGEGLKKFFNIIVTVANGKNNILLGIYLFKTLFYLSIGQKGIFLTSVIHKAKSVFARFKRYFYGRRLVKRIRILGNRKKIIIKV